MGEDIVKTVRLGLFPFQFAGAVQDRLERYLERAVRQVPEARRIEPPESILLPVAEKLRFQEPSNPLTDLYINLLSRALDGERVGEAHPAFITVISQLAPDEVIFVRELSIADHRLVIKVDDNWPTPSAEQIPKVFDDLGMSTELVEKANAILFQYLALSQPELFRVFLEHLNHLGLVEYTNDPSNEGDYKMIRPKKGDPRLIFIRLTSFGRLFYQACISGTADKPRSER